MNDIYLSALVRISADGESQANMTNLAIKGIIGVKAMGEISLAVGEDDDAQTYEVCLSISVIIPRDSTLTCRRHAHLSYLILGSPWRCRRTSRTYSRSMGTSCHGP